MNKHKIRFLATAFVGIFIVGCSTIQPAALKKSYVNLGGKNPSQGSLLVWDSSLSAAVYNPGEAKKNNDGSYETANSRMCAQAARTVRTDQSRLNGAVGADIFAGLPAGTFKNLTDTLPADQQVSLATGLNQSATQLIAISEAISFLDTGMFYLCQIAGNEKLNDEAIQMIAKSIIEGAEKLNKTD